MRAQQFWVTNSTVPLLWREMGTILQKISISLKTDVLVTVTLALTESGCVAAVRVY